MQSGAVGWPRAAQMPVDNDGFVPPEIILDISKRQSAYDMTENWIKIDMRNDASGRTWVNSNGEKAYSEDGYTNDNLMLEALQKSKIFRIDEDLAQALLQTDSVYKFIHSPFPEIFIDTQIRIYDNLVVHGILLVDPTSMLEKLVRESGVGDHLLESYQSLIVMLHFSDLEGTRSQIFPLQHYDKKITNETPHEYEVKQKMKNFVMSFLNFINCPDVEIIKKEYSEERIKKRAERGKISLNHYYLKITGKTKEYIDDFTHEVHERHISHTHSWIVRGFYRELKNECYGDNVGKQIWVRPHVRGLGELKGKDYIVTEKKKLYYNQSLMENVIKNMFYNHIIFHNTRAFLDGYEIDCYIPDLKLGFEYNGEQHYKFTTAFHKCYDDFVRQQKRDIEKNQIAKERGIILITIPYTETPTEDLIKGLVAPFLEVNEQ